LQFATWAAAARRRLTWQPCENAGISQRQHRSEPLHIWIGHLVCATVARLGFGAVLRDFGFPEVTVQRGKKPPFSTLPVDTGNFDIE
jgi:hypothetical protein